MSGRTIDQVVEVMYQRSVHNLETDCWLWQGSCNDNGYGNIYFEGKLHKVHRLSYTHFVGGIGGLHVLHTCDTANCWNPDHLFLGTHLDNMADRDVKGRTLQGSLHGTARLTEEQVLEIRDSDLSWGQLAAKYSVTKPTIQSIIQRRNWRHI